MDSDRDLYDIVLYSLEDKVKYLSKGLNLEQATEYMNNNKTIPHTMIGLMPHNSLKCPTCGGISEGHKRC